MPSRNRKMITMTYNTRDGARFDSSTIERALDLHQEQGRFVSWHNWHEDKPSRRRPLYTVTCTGGRPLDLATMHEARAFLAGLTSANAAINGPGAR